MFGSGADAQSLVPPWGGAGCRAEGRGAQAVRRALKLMLMEPKGVVNTGDARGEMTAKNDVWV
jgi:hypothetical protein